MSSVDMGPYRDMLDPRADMPGPGEVCVSFNPDTLDFGVVILGQRRVERFRGVQLQLA